MLELSFFESLQKALLEGNMDIVRKEILDQNPLEELAAFS